MPTCAVLRIKKVKNYGQLKHSSDHIHRKKYTPNAIAAHRKFNKTLIGSNCIETDCKDYLRKKGIKNLRKNGVLAVQMVLTFSHKFLKYKDGSYKPNAKKNLNLWVQLNLDWLKDQFGDRTINAELHLDEHTPHLHVTLVMSEQKKDGIWKLNTRAFFGGRNKLSALQTSYANEMKPLGLQRGIEGSKAKHQDVSQFYTALNKVKSTCLELGISAPNNNPNDFEQWTIAVSKIADAMSEKHVFKIEQLEKQLRKERAFRESFLNQHYEKLQRELTPNSRMNILN